MCKGINKTEDFIGTTFNTRLGGVITVIGWSGSKTRKGIKICEVICSICSKDKELHPLPFRTIKSRVDRCICPCSCVKNYKWSESQNKIRVERSCAERGFIFNGWSGPYKGGRDTKLDLKNPTTGNRWTSLSIGRFFKGQGDPRIKQKERSDNMTLCDEDNIRDFIKAGLSTEDVFKRNKNKVDSGGRYSYYDFTCHICKDDEYTKAGLCSGTFTVISGRLKRGAIPCRCSKTYRWTEEQRVYQIKKVCKKEGLTFLGFEGNYKKSHTKIEWLCERGHLCNTSITNFLHGTRCPHCCEGVNGYFPARTQEEDNLYVMGFKVGTKLGRSFVVERRRRDLKIQSQEDTLPEVLQLYTATHQVIYETEQAIHSELRERGFQYYCDWTSECFTKDCWNILQEILEDYVSSGALKRIF